MTFSFYDGNEGD